MQFELVLTLLMAFSCAARHHHHRRRQHRTPGHLHSTTDSLFADKFVVLRPTNVNSKSAEISETNWASQETNKILFDHLLFPLIPIENAGIHKTELSPGKHAIKFQTDAELSINQPPNDIKSALKKILMRIDN
ncbi:unnamed protein product [Bursaphelenchus xylophilus]|nr:unnamed protein product [Bursaphelenchus xylophilus]CAG9131774.1 unnamed protein product [Bursaphelenchus xylophilus]